MSNKLNLIIFVVVAFLVVLANSLYIVNEKQITAVTQFERLIDTDDSAGLKFKIPFIHQVEFFDARIQRLDVEPELFLTNEKKYLIVDYFVEWRVDNMRVFYTSVQGNFSRASNLLDQLVKDGLRGEFVQRSVKEVISEDRDSIMDAVTQSLSKDADRYGVEIVGVRLKRVDFSDDIRDRVFERMRAERERVSKNLRAQGREKSQIIMASADREASEIVAQAFEKARIIEGEADAQAAKLYADSYGQDLEFYRFWRSMEAYQSSLADQGAVMIVEPSSAFFDYLDPARLDDQDLDGQDLDDQDASAPGSDSSSASANAADSAQQSADAQSTVEPQSTEAQSANEQVSDAQNTTEQTAADAANSSDNPLFLKPQN